MNTPVINIQEAEVLYVSIKRTSSDSFSKNVKSIPAYKRVVLLHQDLSDISRYKAVLISVN